MLHNFTKRRRWLVVLLSVLIVVALILAGRRMNATKVGGQGAAEPFRIAGNFYYVGATDVAAYLITGPEGHVVLLDLRGIAYNVGARSILQGVFLQIARGQIVTVIGAAPSRPAEFVIFRIRQKVGPAPS